MLVCIWKVDLGRKIKLERGNCVLLKCIKRYFNGNMLFYFNVLGRQLWNCQGTIRVNLIMLLTACQVVQCALLFSQIMVSLGCSSAAAFVRINVFQTDSIYKVNFCCDQLTKNLSKGIMAKNSVTQISSGPFTKCTLPHFRETAQQGL